MKKLNQTLLVSSAEYFTDKDAINALMDSSIPVDIGAAIKEHESILTAFKKIGIKVIKVPAPKDCQDGIYTANWAVVYQGKAIMARLPNKRKAEEIDALKALKELGIETLILPEEIEAFSGQGDTLICDDMAFCQSPYRSSKDSHKFLTDWLGIKKLVELETKPLRWFKIGPPKRNKITGWIDSPTYDIDLALAIIKPGGPNSKALIAYCPDVFKARSRKILSDLKNVDKIIVSKKEALENFALNLVSNGEEVIINKGTTNFKNSLKKAGLKITELELKELKKGGGSIRCTSLWIN